MIVKEMQDPLGRALSEAGLKPEVLKAWFGDCEVQVSAIQRTPGLAL